MWSGDISTDFDSMAGQRDRMLSSINLEEAKWGMVTGVGIVRPLLFDYPEDKNTANYVDA